MIQSNTNHQTKPNKIIVFDLDETLGYFTEFGLFWTSLNTYCKNILGQNEFDSLLDLFPEFIRPNMFQILQYIKYKKELYKCDKIMIYTNNQYPSEWSRMIKNYFESKIQKKMQKNMSKLNEPIIFDQIIQAFKIRGERIELLRTTHKKTHDDLIKCTFLPYNTEIFFLDDALHTDMCSDKIYYINLKPYIYKLQYEQLINRFLKSENLYNMQIKDRIKDKIEFKNEMLRMLNEYDYTYKKKPLEEYDMDKIISKKIMFHLNEFFTKDLSKRTEHIIVVNNSKSVNKFTRCKNYKYRNMNKTKKNI